MRIIWLGHAGCRSEIAGGAGDRTAGVAADHPVTGRKDGRIAHPTYGQVPHGWAAGRCPTSAQVRVAASVIGHANVALQMRRQGMAQHRTRAPLSHQGGRQGQNNPHQPMARDQHMQGVHGPQRVCGDQSSHDIHSTSRPIGVGPGPLRVGGRRAGESLCRLRLGYGQAGLWARRGSGQIVRPNGGRSGLLRSQNGTGW